MPSARIVLNGVGPNLEGLRWETNHVLRIGRLNNQDIILRDYSVAPSHAEVVLQHGVWLLRDVARSEQHPTLVNGVRLVKDKILALDDVIHVGRLALQVAVLEAEPQDVGAVESFSSARTVSRSGSHGLPVDQIRTSGAFVKVQARAQQSWEQAVELAAFGSDPSSSQGRAVLTLLRTNHHLVHVANLDELIQSILLDGIKALNAQHGSIALENEATGELELKAYLAPHAPGTVERAFSKTLAERSFRLGESLLCRDVKADDEMLLARSVRRGSMSSILCAVLRTPRKKLGVLQLDRGPFQEPFTESDLYLLDAMAASAAVGIESAQLVEQQREQFIQTVTSLARAVEMRDQYTGDHTRRVTDYALLLAEELKLLSAEKYKIQVGTPLHDIGKIGIDDAVLRKPGKLTTSEFEYMKSHTVKGAAILDTIFTLGPMIPIVRHHHERWDGSGYPDRIGGEQISLTARIVAVADAFDAMTSDRPYRPALPPDLAFLELHRQAGKHFDPACVQAFLRQRTRVESLLCRS